MSNFCEYYLYQRYEKVGDGEWTPSYPNEYSISGDSSDPMPLVVKRCESPDCGWHEPIYRWTDTDDTICIYNGEYAGQYLTIESVEDNNEITWVTTGSNSSSLSTTISASTDNGISWTAYTSTTGGTTIATLNEGEKVFLKGTNAAYGTSNLGAWSSFSSNKKFNVYGNLMSLVYGDNFINKMTIENRSAFIHLFHGSNVVDAGNLVMQASTLAEYCYYDMFYGCHYLTVAPELPATTLANDCYDGIFAQCTSLTTAPALPASTLANRCYMNMFQGCTSLVNAPVLSSMTLADWCYYLMFNGCTSLTTAPALPATTLTNHCYENMFQGCTSLTVAPELPALTLANNCYDEMFQGCTSLRTAPELPAETLVSNCYYQMFYKASLLNNIKCLATDISATDCTKSWVTDVWANGTFTKAASMSNWTTGNNGIPNNWTIQNA